MSSHTVDHCRLQVNSQLSTAKSRWCWELLQHLSQSTVKYWWCNMDVEWFTLENGMLMETTLTCTRTLCGPLGLKMNSQWSTAECGMEQGVTVAHITGDSKLLVVEYGCKVVMGSTVTCV